MVRGDVSDFERVSDFDFYFLGEGFEDCFWGRVGGVEGCFGFYGVLGGGFGGDKVVG